MTRRIAVRHAWLGPGRWRTRVELVWDAHGVLGPVRAARGRVLDLVVFPGLVDAHAHLQLGALERRPPSFLEWVRAVIDSRSRQTAAQLRAAAARSLRELSASGTTAVGEIDSTGASPAVLARSRVAGRCYQELTGFHLDRAAAAKLVRQRSVAGSAACPGGLSPHAPYSVSAALFAVAAAARRHLAIHVAEVPEEQQFLHTGRGPFADLLAELGRLPEGFRPPGVGAVRWLDRLGLLRPTTQLVHCQELERGDVDLVRSAGAPVCVCPGTIEYFGRTPPPVPRWLARGLVIALGTDSRASNQGLSMRAELARAARMWPQLSGEALWSMATAHGGAALGRRVGTLRAGGRADFVAFAAGADDRAALALAAAAGELPLAAVWLSGRRVNGA